MVGQKENSNIERIMLIGSIVFFVIAVLFIGWTFYYNNYIYEAPFEFNFTLEEYLLEDNNKNNNSIWVEVKNITPLNLSLLSPLPY